MTKHFFRLDVPPRWMIWLGGWMDMNGRVTDLERRVVALERQLRDQKEGAK